MYLLLQGIAKYHDLSHHEIVHEYAFNITLLRKYYIMGGPNFAYWLVLHSLLTFHNIIQIHNNVLWDKKKSTIYPP